MKPEMILFDYGQTLICEEKFNPLAGDQALLDRAVKNPNHVGIREIQQVAAQMTKDIADSFPNGIRSYHPLEITNECFNRYLYEYLDLEFDMTPDEMTEVFWSHAASAEPTKNIEKLLTFLKQEGIRMGIVSNMMFSGEVLKRRLKRMLPDFSFEFVLTSSDYVFRKPYPQIFRMALHKAGLPAEKIWFCGDNLLCDIQGSYEAGMKPVWYPVCIDGDYQVQTDVPYVEIGDWEELITMIKDIR